jgi:hypothetical protein
MQGNSSISCEASLSGRGVLGNNVSSPPERTALRSGCMSPGRDRYELNDLLDEQLEFLRTSEQAFDHGVSSEYKRIALVLRVLLHDTGQSLTAGTAWWQAKPGVLGYASSACRRDRPPGLEPTRLADRHGHDDGHT